MRVITVLWKTLVVIGATIIGCIAANQAAWSGANFFLNEDKFSLIDNVDHIIMWVSGAIAYGTLWVVWRLAKPALWVVVPVMAYSAIVLGIWNGVASDFDLMFLGAMQHHYADIYVLQKMKPTNVHLACHNERIKLSEDGKAYCEQLQQTEK